MANKKGRRRRFGAVRQYRSGRWTASYIGPDGVRIHAPETFATKKEAEIWLSQVEADLTRGDWRAPDAGAVNFKIYAEKWVEERELAVRTVDLYEHLFRLYIFPTFGALDLRDHRPSRPRMACGAPARHEGEDHGRQGVQAREEHHGNRSGRRTDQPQPVPYQGRGQGVGR